MKMRNCAARNFKLELPHAAQTSAIQQFLSQNEMRLSALLAACLSSSAASAAPLAAANLRVEYLARGVTESRAPRFSWEPVSVDRGATQASYRIAVSALGGALVWDSGIVASSESAHIAYAGAALVSDTTYNYTVSWTDGNGAAAPPATGVFATGLLTQAEWVPADWIGCPVGTAPTYNQLRTEVSLGLAPGVTITQARAYLAGLGYVSLRVNGDWAPHFSGVHPRNDPGWTTYEQRSLYSTYDLTAVLSANAPNAFALQIGNGWPVIGPVPGNNSATARASARDGSLRMARMLVSVRDSTGATTTWTTTAGGFERTGATAAATWMCGAGAQLDDDVYDGVTYDARLETTGWDVPGFDASNWTAAVLRADPGGATPTTMSTQAMPPISVQTEIDAIGMWQPAPGVTVFDFGQNFAGFVRLTLPAPVAPGVTITLRHAEVLQHPPYGPIDGSIYVGNLRSAKATDTYTTRGSSGAEIWEPQFTYHGFRYVELTGLADPSLDTVKGLFIRTGVDHVGALAFPETAQPLNQLAHAVQWGIGCNLMSVVSDCPQRDERKGWMVSNHARKRLEGATCANPNSISLSSLDPTEPFREIPGCHSSRRTTPTAWARCIRCGRKISAIRSSTRATPTPPGRFLTRSRTLSGRTPATPRGARHTPASFTPRGACWVTLKSQSITTTTSRSTLTS